MCYAELREDAEARYTRALCQWYAYNLSPWPVILAVSIAPFQAGTGVLFELPIDFTMKSYAASTRSMRWPIAHRGMGDQKSESN